MRTVVEFSFDAVAGATLAVAGFILLVFRVWIAPANHKGRNDAMKDRLVIKSRLGKLNKIFYVLWRFLGKEANLNAAKFGVNNGPRLLSVHCLSVWRSKVIPWRLRPFASRRKRTYDEHLPLSINPPSPQLFQQALP
jgi:hypothetical protein